METNSEQTNRPTHIRELYLFNSSFGNDSDDEIGKVLYCYPGNTDEDKQLKQIGLCEAVVKFAQTFNSEKPCESLHTLKSRHIFFEPEPDFWFILVLSIPSVLKTNLDGLEYLDYLDEEVQDEVFHHVLLRIYQKFVLLHDKLSVIADGGGGGLSDLRAKLKKYFDAWVQRTDASQCGIADIFRGLQFLPLQRDAFLHIQCFINNVMLTFPSVKYVLLLQRDKLIWSGVDQSHIQLLYDHVVNDLLSQHFLTGADKQSTFGVILKRESYVTIVQNNDMANGVSSSDHNFGDHHRSETSCPQSSTPSEEDDATSFMTASTHTLNGNRSSSKKYHMLIYKAEQSYVTILVPDFAPFDRQHITKIETFLNLNFTPIARDLAKSQRTGGMPVPSLPGMLTAATADPPPNTKYIYFNNLNFAEKVSAGYQYDTESYKLLADLKRDLSRMNENGEIITKMVSDNWMVAKVSNKREFYAIFNQKNANLLEIDEEMRKLTESHLTNIFFQE